MGLDSHIRVSDEMYRELNSRKSQGDTFNDVIRELVEDAD